MRSLRSQVTTSIDSEDKLKNKTKVQFLLAVLVVGIVTPSIFCGFKKYICSQDNWSYKVIYITMLIIAVIGIFLLQLDKKHVREKEKLNDLDRKNEQALLKWQSVLRSKAAWDYLKDEIQNNKGKASLWSAVIDRMQLLTEAEEEFLKHLGHIYVETLSKKRKNKEMYFKIQKKSANYKNIKGLIEEIYDKRTVIAGVVGCVVSGALTVFISNFSSWVTAVAILVVIFISAGFCGFIVLQCSRYEAEIELKKYGETWVRHEANIFRLENIMLKFVLELGEYADVGIGKSEKRLFMQQISEALLKNENKFQENMKEIM